MKTYKEMSEYDIETLSALYKSHDFMICNDIDGSEVIKAIWVIECKYTESLA